MVPHAKRRNQFPGTENASSSGSTVAWRPDVDRGPVPRVLWHPRLAARTDGHPSGTAIARGLERLPVAPGAGRSCALAGRPLFALHRVGFALPCLSPAKRWALTPPFHPCLWPCGPSAVSSLLHFPSRRRAQPLAGTPPCGARKFLQACRPAAIRPPTTSWSNRKSTSRRPRHRRRLSNRRRRV